MKYTDIGLNKLWTVCDLHKILNYLSYLLTVNDLIVQMLRTKKNFRKENTDVANETFHLTADGRGSFWKFPKSFIR